VEPARLSIEHCGEVTVQVDADVTAQANYDVAVQPYRCATGGIAGGTLLDCEKVLVDRTGDGIVDDLALNGDPAQARDGLYAFSGAWLGLDVVNTNSRTLEITVRCGK
jgi:hypothetical protein